MKFRSFKLKKLYSLKTLEWNKLKLCMHIACSSLTSYSLRGIEVTEFQCCSQHQCSIWLQSLIWFIKVLQLFSTILSLWNSSGKLSTIAYHWTKILCLNWDEIQSLFPELCGVEISEATERCPKPIPKMILSSNCTRSSFNQNTWKHYFFFSMDNLEICCCPLWLWIKSDLKSPE